MEYQTTYHPIKIESPVANFVIDTVACAYLGLGMLFRPVLRRNAP